MAAVVGLKIKHYEETGLLRSIGDAPNGIVGVCLGDDGVHFSVNPKYQPETTEGRGVRVEVVEGDAEGAGEPLTVEETIEAAADRHTAHMLWIAAVVQFQHCTNRWLPGYAVEPVEDAVRFLREVRDQLAVNGWIEKVRP
jgi:hypothetical protein